MTTAQGIWDRILTITGDDPFTLYIYGTLALFIGVYWSFGLLYTLLDILNRPAALRRYKIQPGTNEPVDSWRLIKVIALVLFNQSVASLPLAYVFFFLLQWRGIPDVHVLPSFSTAVAQFIGCILVEEVVFYYVHRLLHHPRLYKHVHKLHHSWTAPVAIVALYAHPIEYIVADIGPPFVAVLVCNCHISVGWLWFGLATLFTLNEHCGYHLPFVTSPEAHDFHHFQFNNCFGTGLGLLDWLHGTDLNFRNSKAHPRHLVLTSLKSARELIPDENLKSE